MQLTDEQKRTVAEWVAKGLGLGDIQRRLGAELGVNMTYMDVRLLVLDLGVAIKDKPAPKPTPVTGPVTGPGGALGGGLGGGSSPAAPPAGGVTVSLDRLMKPGALVSGTVTFSDGVTANWALDQMGRLALDARQPGYRPVEADVRAFQTQLQGLLERQGL